MPSALNLATAKIRAQLGYSTNKPTPNEIANAQQRTAEWEAENAARKIANAAARATTPSPQPTKKCGKKPMAWLGTQKNPAFAEWNACVKSGGIAAGGKRKTQRRKSMKRKTHKRR